MRRTFTVDARLDQLTVLQERVTAFGKSENWPQDMTAVVELMLEEVCVNIVNYGFEDDGEEHTVEVVVDLQPNTLAMEIIDNGRAFDPLQQAPEPDLDSALDDRPVGGLGIYLVKHYMDELQYRREGGRNHLKLAKHRSE